VDLETRDRRPSVKADVEMMALISDYLSSIDEIMAVGPRGHFMDRDFTFSNVRKLWIHYEVLLHPLKEK
jgi:hypothetical protein